MGLQVGFVALLLLLIALAGSTFRILREYERGVVFQLGRFWQVKGPGLILLIPVVQQMVRVDLRTVVLDVPAQDVITRDNVSVKVNAVLYFRVLDPQKAIIQVEDFLMATSQLAQTTLRAVLGKHELDELLAERERLNIDIQQVLDAQTDAWGIKVANVEIKHVDLNESMIRAIAKQAEAERERRAKVIHAEGELQASEKLMQAAEMLGRQPGAMQLRYMQTLSSIAGDKSSTIVFPLPIELLKGMAKLSPEEKKTRGAAINETKQRIEAALTDFFSFDRVSFGQTIHFSDLVALIDGVRRFAMDVRELDIDLIDRINPFGEAYAILAKTMSEDSLKQVAAAISAKRTSLTPDEAKESLSGLARA